MDDTKLMPEKNKAGSMCTEICEKKYLQKVICDLADACNYRQFAVLEKYQAEISAARAALADKGEGK